MSHASARQRRQLFSALQTLLARRWLRPASSGLPQRRRCQPCLEVLEDRTVLATLTPGPNVNVSEMRGNQAQSTISINPANPMNLFEMDTLSGVGNISMNGGTTWLTSNLSAL